MYSYLRMIDQVLMYGEDRETRNGPTRSTFGYFFEHDLKHGFPLLTTKEMKIKSIVSEVAWILSGSRDERYLAKLNSTKKTVWTANADSYQGEFPGDVGFIYGPLLRNFHGVDQLQRIVSLLHHNPTDRRMLVTMWDPSEKRQCLPTCHFSWQVYVRDKTYLDLMWHQRSVDVGLGLPYDIAHYAFINHLLAQTVGLKPGKLFGTLGDTHIYDKHKTQLIEQLSRTPEPLPKLLLNKNASVFHFDVSDVVVQGYKSHPPLKMEMIV